MRRTPYWLAICYFAHTLMLPLSTFTDMKLVEAVVQSGRAYPHLFNKETEDDGMNGNGYH